MKKKSMITIAVLSVFVMIAIAVNWNGSFFRSLVAPSDPDAGKDPSVEAGATPQEDTYFDNARYTRTQSREEALALLHSIVNDDSVDELTREKAYLEIVAYAKITEGEAGLESILKAKGFSDCIVFLTSDTATVVVAAETLTESQSAQIFDAVLSHTGFESGSVKIVTYT